MATTRMETTHGLSYLVARVIEVTAWQSVNAICLCCLTNGSCFEVIGLQFLLTCERRWLECCDMSMPSPPTACAGPTCVQHALYIVARPNSQSVYTCVCFVIFCGLRFNHILMTFSHMHLTAPCSAHALSQARPTMLCIHLVYPSMLIATPLLLTRSKKFSPKKIEIKWDLVMDCPLKKAKK